jgi:ABC-type nickel/cobalt efflux system permease component RcnA
MMNLPVFIGMTAAMVHVISGPDHLAAVTPLVFDTYRKHWKIGFFWGIGHIIGMLLIGVLFYFFKDYIPVERISKYSEQFVGVILIGIGIWAFYRIKHKSKWHRHPHFHKEEDLMHIHEHSHGSTSHTHKHIDSAHQNYFTSLSVGIIHGFAGIAHFVLLLPVLGFKTKLESAQYMVGFAIGILFAMVLYTGIIGKLNKKPLDNESKPIYKYFRFWSGLVAIGVGVFWIVSNLS